MSMQDLLSDYVARVNNSITAEKSTAKVIKSKVIVEVTKKLTKAGYFASYDVENNEVVITIAPKLQRIKRVSRPGQRIYGSYLELPRINNGFGTNIVSTSKGIMTSKECKEAKLGGEFLLQVLVS
jgi:small subunit ribosomal protein S8